MRKQAKKICVLAVLGVMVGVVPIKTLGSTDINLDIKKIPETQWKVDGEDYIIKYEPLELVNEEAAKLLRFKGYSLTPIIEDDSEIVLSAEKPEFVDYLDEDIALYGQWDSSFNIAYIGNEQTEGVNHDVHLADWQGDITMDVNEGSGKFVKIVEKRTIDRSTGEWEDDDGNAIYEEVSCSLQGWSLYKNKESQKTKKKYLKEKTYNSRDTLWYAMENGLLTYGVPSRDYYTGPSESAEVDMVSVVRGGSQLTEVEEDTPFLNMYAIWDESPQIIVSDYYYTLKFAQSTSETEGITIEELLSEVAVTDAEDGTIEYIPEDEFPSVEECVEDKTYYTIVGYSASDFTQFDDAGSVSVTFRAMDSVGNITTTMVMVHLVDTTPQIIDKGHVRFIDEKYYRLPEEEGGLPADSVWLTDPEYVEVIERTFENQRNGTPVQSWTFTYEDVLDVQQYIDEHGFGNSKEPDALKNFLTEFSHCRTK